MTKLNGLTVGRIQVLSFVVLTIVNYLTYRNNTLAISIGIIEVLVVLYQLIRLRVDKALLYLIFFLSTVIENSFFATGMMSDELKLYSFYALPLVRTYHILLIIGCMFIISSIKSSNDKFIKRNKRLVYFWLISFLVTVFCFAVNNNGVRKIWGLTRLVIVDGYNAFFTIGLLVITLKLLNSVSDFSNRLRTLIISIFEGIVIAAALILVLGGTRRTDSGDIYLICPLVLYWSPALILFYKYDRKISYIVLSVISVLIQIKYTVGIPGAWWISTGIIFLYFIITILKDFNFLRERKFILFFSLIFIVIGITGILIILSSSNNGGKLSYISYKLTTVFSIFSFSSDPKIWLSGLGNSIGVRVEEIINIFIELIKNPIYIVFGKGFGGTIVHHWGVFWWGRTGNFSDVQNQYEVYSVFHTGIAEMIINFGIVGLVIVVKCLKYVFDCVFRKRDNPFILLGSLYLLLFYSYYWSMILCIIIFAFGVYKEDTKNNSGLSIYAEE